MQVFVSWSGARSKVMAAALKTWLADVFQDVETWMSEHDIDAGAQWNVHLSQKLESASFGVLCLTPENIAAPWLLFEAGALSKIVKSARVVPYRLELKATDVPYPLAQFQGVDANAIGTLKLLQSINDSREAPMSDERIRRLFEKWWPDLQQALSSIPPAMEEPEQKRSDRSLLEELLQLVRQQTQANQGTSPQEGSGQPPGPFGRVEEPVRRGEVVDAVRGMQVRHEHFGRGSIVATEGAGPNAKVTVDFGGTVGLKRVIARFLLPIDNAATSAPPW